MEDGLCFRQRNGGHIGDINQAFNSPCGRTSLKDFPFHDRRDTYASHMAIRGVHIRALQELLGCKTVSNDAEVSPPVLEKPQNVVKLLDGVIREKRELVGQVWS